MAAKMKRYRLAILTACFFIFLGALARYAIGEVYSTGEALDLMRTLTDSGLYLGSAAATASATVIALMLTITSMIRRIDAQFDRSVWKSIDRVSQLSILSLIASLTLLLTLVFPVGEFENLPAGWFVTLYDGLFALTVLVIALLAATVVQLYSTLQAVIAEITPSEDV